MRHSSLRRVPLIAASALGLVLSPLAAPAALAAEDGPVVSGDDWTVEAVPGGYEITMELDAPLEVRADVPTLWVDGVNLGIATESLDGQTLSLVTNDPAAVSGDDIVQGWSGTDPEATQAIQQMAETLAPLEETAESVALDADPSEMGEYTVGRYDYDLGDEAVELRGFDRMGEIRAALFVPEEAVGERPVVLFLHGRHTGCSGGTRNPDRWPCNDDQTDIPSYLGYNDAAEILASQGYAVVSISANAINSLDGSLADDTGAAARGQLVLDHLELLREANAGTAPEGISSALAGRLDLDNVGLMGHSRGGEGIMRAAVMNNELDEPFGINGVLPLAPTDYTRITVPGIPTAVILPYCDGDVEDQMGQKFINDSRHAYGDDVLRSSVLVMGTNHNFFNEYWTPSKYDIATSDDWRIMDRAQVDPTCGENAPTRLDADEQYAFGNAYMAAWFRLTLGGDDEFLPMFDGSDAIPASAGIADVRVSATQPSSARLDIDNFDSAETEVQVVGSGDFAVCENLEPLIVPGTLPYCITELEFAQAPDWSTLGGNGKAGSVPSTTAMHFEYTAPSSASAPAGELRVPVPGGSIDASGYQELSFRVTPDDSVPADGSTDLTVTLLDAAGGSASVLASEFGDALQVLPGTGNPLRKALLQQITVPVDEFDGVDLAAITQVRFTAPREDGGVILSDLALLGESALGTPEGSDRPLASVPDIWVEEGDGVTSVDLPITLSAPATEPATMYLTMLGSDNGRLAPSMEEVRFARGEQCVVVTVPVYGDDVASGNPSASYVYNVSKTIGGATIGESFGSVSVREDDGENLLPPVGSQGDACAEALGQVGTLTASASDITPGGELPLEGAGFRAGESVTIALGDVELADVVSEDGTFVLDVVVPADTELGDYAITATGFGSGITATTDVTVADLDVELAALLACVGPNTRLTVEAANAEDVPVSVDIDSEYGAKSLTNVQPGKDKSATFTIRSGDVPSGGVSVLLTAVIDGDEVTEAATVPFEGVSCG